MRIGCKFHSDPNSYKILDLYSTSATNWITRILSDSLELFATIILIIVVLGIVAWYLWSIGWALTKRPLTGPESLIRKTGVVVTPPEQNKTGEVNIDGIIWKAKLSDDEQSDTTRIASGDRVVVVGYSALTVVVKKTKS